MEEEENYNRDELEESEEYQDPSIDMTQDIKVQVEVKRIGVKEFLLNFFDKQTQGGFLKLMEAVNSAGLTVTNANVTNFKGMASYILILAADHEEVQEQEVKDLLLNLTHSNG
ncbi:transcription factor ABORTED MICROSPORES-like [Papaver somniferum]|uniref:transcription factor ABORTED MICROSPORES-like n=1 Tax=Papaver somniferum TaxID=3469 RepID=UPI000E6FAEEF|nr:transcription factor ABORTED MICROSPORES-like [Papaver somniferum]